MEVRENGHQYKSFKRWSQLKHLPYDYEEKGLSSRILSHKIWGSDNIFLKYLIKVYDKMLTAMLKSVDELHNYHWYLWRNR